LEQLGAIGTGGTENQTPIDPASAYLTNIVSGVCLEVVDVLLNALASLLLIIDYNLPNATSLSA